MSSQLEKHFKQLGIKDPAAPKEPETIKQKIEKQVYNPLIEPQAKNLAAESGFLGKRTSLDSSQFTYFKKSAEMQSSRSPYLHNRPYQIEDTPTEQTKRFRHYSYGKSMTPRLFAPLESIHSTAENSSILDHAFKKVGNVIQEHRMSNHKNPIYY